MLRLFGVGQALWGVSLSVPLLLPLGWVWINPLVFGQNSLAEGAEDLWCWMTGEFQLL